MSIPPGFKSAQSISPSLVPMSSDSKADTSPRSGESSTKAKVSKTNESIAKEEKKPRLIVTASLEAVDTANLIGLSGTNVGSATNSFSASAPDVVLSILDFMRSQKESQLPIANLDNTIVSVKNINNSDINSLSSINIEEANVSKYAIMLTTLTDAELNALKETHVYNIGLTDKELEKANLRLNKQVKSSDFQWGSFKAGAQTILTAAKDKTKEEYNTILKNTVDSFSGKANSYKKSGKQFWKDIKSSPATIKKLFNIDVKPQVSPLDSGQMIKKIATKLSISEIEASRRFGSVVNNMKESNDKSNNNEIVNKTSAAAVNTQTTVVKNYKSQKKSQSKKDSLKEELDLIDKEILSRSSK